MSAPLSVPRNPAFDFTKGVLVLLMLGYHWMNYFVSTEGAIYSYLRFVTPSFIFIAGFLIANIYPVKYGWGSPQVSKRLLIRGCKLLGLFMILNVTANLMFANNYKGAMPGIDSFLHNASDIYLSGNARSSFWVLVPISYLLLLSAAIFSMGNASKYVLLPLCTFMLLCAVLLNMYGRSSANLELIAIGLLGMAVGLFPIQTINKWAQHSYIVVGLNVAYLLAIMTWDALYYLQVVGVCVSVMIIYSIGMKSVLWSTIQSKIYLLGEYSLFAYVAQIGLLQILYRGLPLLHLQVTALWVLSFTGAVALTVMTVKALHWSRGKWLCIDKMYKFAFS